MERRRRGPRGVREGGRGDGSEFHRRDRAREVTATGRGGRRSGGRTMVRRSPRGCLRRLYADEEGRATMTRDDVSGAPQRAPSGKQTHPRAARTEGRAVPRGGARADGMPLWLVLRCPSPGTLLLLLLGLSLPPSLLILPPQGHHLSETQTRSCTTHSYINMSSSREEIEPIRAQRTHPASPSLLPSHPLSSSGSDCPLRGSRRVETCRRHRARRRTPGRADVPVRVPSSLPLPPLYPPLSHSPSPSLEARPPLASDSAGSWAFSFARAGYRGQFVTRIRAGPFYKRNNYSARLSSSGIQTRARLARNDSHNRIGKRAIYLSTA